MDRPLALSEGAGSVEHRAVPGIRPDGLDHQIESVGAVDLSGDAIILARCGCVGSGEVMQPVNAAGLSCSDPKT